MKFKDITKRNFNPKDWLSRTNKSSLYVPAYAVDVNNLGDDVDQLYSNFKTATGAFTAGTGATGGFSISDTDVDSDTKLVATITDVVSVSSGWPVLASAIPGSDTISVVFTNFDSNTPLNGATVEVTYFINKELS